MEGEIPLIWKAVKESADERGIAKRFRQLGADHIIYNYVAVEWFALSYRVFPWDEGMVRRYVNYCKLYEVPVYRTETSDFLQGGHLIYRVSRKPSRHPPAVILAAPGMDNLYGDWIAARIDGRIQDAVAFLAKIYKATPDVCASATKLGQACDVLGDYKRAFEVLCPWIGRGMVDECNLLIFGTSALRLGKIDVAEKALQQSLVHYPDQRSSICVNLAMIRVVRAMAQMNEGRLEAAANLMREGEEFIAKTPESGNHEKARRATLAGLKSLRANLAFQRGDPRAAAGLLREALRINPDDENAAQWRGLANQIDPGMH
jgi:tetratricopeptide (TPR) repeat protein